MLTPQDCMSRDGPVFELNGTKILWNGTRYSRTWIDASIPKVRTPRRTQLGALALRLNLGQS